MNEDKQYKKRDALYSKYIKHKPTGEDIDMLTESKTDPQSGEDGSERYRDNKDAA